MDRSWIRFEISAKMKRPLFQLICWTYTFLLWFVLCDGKILLGNGQSQYSRVSNGYHFIRARTQIQGNKYAVAVNPNDGVLTDNEQVGGTELTEETDVTVGNGEVTVDIPGAYEGQGTVEVQIKEEGAEPVVIGTDAYQPLLSGQDGEVDLTDDMPPIVEELPPEIIISTQYCKLN